MAASGVAMADGSFPIRNREDLANAIAAAGRSGHTTTGVRRHIVKRATALGLTGYLKAHTSWYTG